MATKHKAAGWTYHTWDVDESLTGVLNNIRRVNNGILRSEVSRQMTSQWQCKRLASLLLLALIAVGGVPALLLDQWKIGSMLVVAFAPTASVVPLVAAALGPYQRLPWLRRRALWLTAVWVASVFYKGLLMKLLPETPVWTAYALVHLPILLLFQYTRTEWRSWGTTTLLTYIEAAQGRLKACRWLKNTYGCRSWWHIELLPLLYWVAAFLPNTISYYLMERYVAR